MVQAKIPYEKIAHMQEHERQAYAQAWLYMHENKRE